MRKLLSLTLGTSFLSLVVFATTAVGQPTADPFSSSLPLKSQVTLSLDEFEELYAQARLAKAERRLLDQGQKQEAEHQRKLEDLDEARMQATSFRNSQIQEKNQEMFPDNFQVVKHTAFGIFNTSAPEAGVEGDVASFEVELIIRIMDSAKWTAVPLVNISSTVSANWQVSMQQEDETIDSSFRHVDTVSDPSLVLLIRENQQVLATNQSGLFKINFKAYTRVSKTRNLNSMSLSSLLYPFSEFKFRIANANPGTTSRDFNVLPASAVLQTQGFENFTDLQATLPLDADSIQIRWTNVAYEQDDENGEFGTATSIDPGAKTPASSKIDDPQVTATHEVMHTIGEGVLRSVHTLDFKTTSLEVSPLNTVVFEVHGNDVRVTSVVAHALQSWTIVDEGTDVDYAAPSYLLVKAQFKTSQLDSSVSLQVHTEKERTNSDKRIEIVELPRIECRNVLRQTGQVAVTKDANVEVHEHKIVDLSRCEPSELSSQLRLNIDRPIVLSYKYLNPENAIATVNVQEHAAMETLDATIDRVHYKALVTATHTVHSLIVILQSTKLQYLEMLDLPQTASKYTVLVNSVPAKPVQGASNDGQNSILVPLLVGLNPEAANRGGSLRTSVEMTFFSSHDEPLGTNGTISLHPPRFDLPISVLTTHLLLPQKFLYEFTGDFGTKSLPKLDFPVPEPFAYRKGKRVVRDDYQFSFKDDMWPDDDEDDDGDYDDRFEGTKTKSNLGVKILTPRAGRSFYFQELLVVDKGLEMTVAYKEPQEPTPEAPKRPLWRQRLFWG